MCASVCVCVYLNKIILIIYKQEIVKVLIGEKVAPALALLKKIASKDVFERAHTSLKAANLHLIE